LSASQTGFRKGMGTIDNLYVLNYLMNRPLGKEKRRMVTMFIDLKGAFDAVNKDVLGKVLKRREMRKSLRKRVREISNQMRICLYTVKAGS